MLSRKFLVLSLIALIFAVIGVIFYKIELKYLAPTTKPVGYKNVRLNSKVEIDDLISSSQDLPTFFHFYNPDCPCSRFNLQHFNDLVTRYKNKIRFVVVAQRNNDKTFGIVKEQFESLAKVQIVLDKNKNIATRMGVYSTPQAVLLSKDRKLFYRGNYNKSRYCTDPSKFYAQQALDSLLASKGVPVFDKSATTAYGCGLDEEKDILDKLLMFK